MNKKKSLADILRDIENRRQLVHNSAKVLNDIVRHLTAGLHSLARQMDTGLDRLNKYELWRWIIVLGKLMYYNTTSPCPSGHKPRW